MGSGSAVTLVPQPWPREDLPYAGVVEYKREPRRGPREITSYLVSMTYGLLLGRVYSRTRGTRRPWWFAEGWTPETDGKVLGPFDRRWEVFEALYNVEVKGRWPPRSLVESLSGASDARRSGAQ